MTLSDAEIVRLAAGINGKKGGRARTPKKIASARRNGKLGGRPRTKKQK